MSADSDTSSQGELQELTAYYAQLVIFNYADLAAFALVMFEHVTTFDREVQFAWGRKLSGRRCVFLLNRYLTIAEYLVVLGPLLPTPTLLSCVVLTRLTQAFQIVLYTVWAAFSGLRVYAISAHNIPITILVVSLALVPVATNLYIIPLTEMALSDAGCMSGVGQISYAKWIELSAITRLCLIASDATVILATLWKTWGTMRLARKLRVQMSLTSLILKEGVLYFAILLTLNIIQIIFDFVGSGTFGLIIPFVNAMTPILISRFLLDLDDLARSPTPQYSTFMSWTSQLQFSNLEFIDPVDSNSEGAWSAAPCTGSQDTERHVEDGGADVEAWAAAVQYKKT